MFTPQIRYLGQNSGAAALGMFQRFQHHHCCPFAEDQTIVVAVAQNGRQAVAGSSLRVDMAPRRLNEAIINGV